MYSMPHMLARLILCIGSLAHLSLQETKTCYACASESLSSRWHITGLPRVQDSLFGDCSSQSVAKMRVESCSGSCFTYMFEDPDVTPNSGNGNVLLVVRGCHTSLTTVVSERSNGAGGNFYCEYDATHQMSNSKGELVSVRALAEFCRLDSNFVQIQGLKHDF
ncbi:hypothetical protein Y032_0028g1643 [Ancylostoma ceylanicum]|uniref:Uncharacterized protein n=3 Tax=Ancylostoma ceylanicum TaxID=53326 RepID=A0A016UUC0_9BILA|nr:hypothetical protein Y032_0028g1643 [Ancylostoma ceylanicum]